MNIVGIGDLLIPNKYIELGFENLIKNGNDLKTVNWDTKDYEELQMINLLIETEGSEAYEVPEYILEAIKDAEIIITQFCPINKKVMNSCKKLKAIGVLRGGIENINLEQASEEGIVVLNTPGRNATAVADFTIGMILSECRNIAKSHLNLKEGKWIRDYDNKDAVPDLEGKTVGLVGLGEIGKKVIKRLKGFDVNVIVYDPYIKLLPEGTKKVELKELMRESDFISIHARLTEENEHMINKELLSLMKSTGYIINTARSGLIDEDALFEVLSKKSIAGAAIDVFDVEPPEKNYPLINLDNITVTPHLAGGTKDAFTGSPKLLAKEIENFINEKPSNSVMNKEIYKEIYGVE